MCAVFHNHMGNSNEPPVSIWFQLDVFFLFLGSDRRVDRAERWRQQRQQRRRRGETTDQWRPSLEQTSAICTQVSGQENEEAAT